MKCSTPEQKLAIAQFERGKPYSDLEFEYQLHRLPQPDDVLQEFELPSGVNLVARNEDKGEKLFLLYIIMYRQSTSLSYASTSNKNA